MNRLKGLCRMCGERFDPALGSFNIFEPRGSEPPYSVVLQNLMGLVPVKGDNRPERLGVTCAKLLDDWATFKRKCDATQEKMLEKIREEKKRKEEAKASCSHCNNDDGASTSGVVSTSAIVKKQGSKPHQDSLSSDSDDDTKQNSEACSPGKLKKGNKQPIKKRQAPPSTDSDDNGASTSAGTKGKSKKVAKQAPKKRQAPPSTDSDDDYVSSTSAGTKGKSKKVVKRSPKKRQSSPAPNDDDDMIEQDNKDEDSMPANIAGKSIKCKNQGIKNLQALPLNDSDDNGAATPASTSGKSKK